MCKAIALGGLSRPQHFEREGEPETLHQRYESWKMDLEIYITATGVCNAEQKRVILLLKGGESQRDRWRNFTEQKKTEQEATNPGINKRDVYLVAVHQHFALKENILKANTKETEQLHNSPQGTGEAVQFWKWFWQFSQRYDAPPYKTTKSQS